MAIVGIFSPVLYTTQPIQTVLVRSLSNSHNYTSTVAVTAVSAVDIDYMGYYWPIATTFI
jgi:hypothetical protein